MQSLETTLRAYGDAWLETEPARIRALLELCWADDGLYQDPQGEARGREALVQYIAGFHGARPGARIELVGGVDGHHDKIRFAWRMVRADGAVAVEGVDFGTVGSDGRLTQVIGFFGATPPR